MSAVRAPKRHGPDTKVTPLVVYAGILLGGLIGYFGGELGLIGRPHWLHYLPIMPLALVGALLGKWIYRLRNYEDII